MALQPALGRQCRAFTNPATCSINASGWIRAFWSQIHAVSVGEQSQPIPRS
jgi:hypothetical protein